MPTKIIKKPGQYIRTPEIREKNRKASIGQKHSTGDKQKISAFMKKWHQEHRHPFRGKKHSETTRRMMCLNRQGSKNASWRGGIGKEPYPFDFNKELKELIRKRDDYKCRLCEKKQIEQERKLSIHHIDYNKQNIDPKNLIALCNSCNIKVNFSRKSWAQVFQLQLKLVKGKKYG